MKDDNHTRHDDDYRNGHAPGAAGETGPPSTSAPINDFMPYMEGIEVSDAEKRAYLETLWNILLTFIDLRFGLPGSALNDPQISEIIALHTSKAGILPADVLGSHEHSNKTQHTEKEAQL